VQARSRAQHNLRVFFCLRIRSSAKRDLPPEILLRTVISFHQHIKVQTYFRAKSRGERATAGEGTQKLVAGRNGRPRNPITIQAEQRLADVEYEQRRRNNNEGASPTGMDGWVRAHIASNNGATDQLIRIVIAKPRICKPPNR